MKVLFVFLYIIIFSFFHAKDIAEYSYKLNDDYLRMKFTIEKAEVNNFNFNSDCNINQMTALCLTKYINEKSYIKINGKTVELKLNDSYIHNCRICKKYDILPINEIIYLYE